jgi:methylmalonyl-CoA/ethylmalonyl-CoA epimerase
MKQVVQVGIVVRDVEKASRLWARLLGTEVPTVAETETPDVTHMTYRGDISPGRAKLAFFALENMTIELIEPIGGPSTWKDFLEGHGEGVHHIAFNVGDMAKSIESLKALGIVIEQRGDFTGGCYAYTSPTGGLGAILELLGRK